MSLKCLTSLLTRSINVSMGGKLAGDIKSLPIDKSNYLRHNSACWTTLTLEASIRKNCIKSNSSWNQLWCTLRWNESPLDNNLIYAGVSGKSDIFTTFTSSCCSSWEWSSWCCCCCCFSGILFLRVRNRLLPPLLVGLLGSPAGNLSLKDFKRAHWFEDTPIVDTASLVILIVPVPLPAFCLL